MRPLQWCSRGEPKPRKTGFRFPVRGVPLSAFALRLGQCPGPRQPFAPGPPGRAVRRKLPPKPPPAIPQFGCLWRIPCQHDCTTPILRARIDPVKRRSLKMGAHRRSVRAIWPPQTAPQTRPLGKRLRAPGGSPVHPEVIPFMLYPDLRLVRFVLTHLAGAESASAFGPAPSSYPSSHGSPAAAPPAYPLD